jgi:hypothetical protein
MKYLSLILLAVLVSCKPQEYEQRVFIDLKGEWQFALDSARLGEDQKWYLSDFSDHMELPGTTDLNEKGFLNKDTTTLHLNRIFKYEGIAWYRKKVSIPENLRDKHLQLSLERTKPSKIWIDSLYVGSSKLLQSPQKYDVTDYLTPGVHDITILVNNDLKLTPYGNVHIYSDDTQTNWNGILGEIYIEASARTHISKLRVSPDIEKKSINIILQIDNPLTLENIDIELHIEKTLHGRSYRLKPKKVNEKCRNIIHLDYSLSDECSLWDDYERPLYKLTVIISNGKIKDSKTVSFGMREFAVKGTQFTINGRTTFLRGKNDAAVFPITGFPPMDVEGWLRVFRIAKSYGLNHYRYHSYCPPEAAFYAADMEGIFLQVELPFWGGLDSDSIAETLREEGFAMLDAYANHPSFVMFSHGNEIWGGHDRVEENIIAFKDYDDRPLYTMGSNNNIGYIAPRACSDFFVGARIPFAYDTILTHTRLTHSFADSKQGGILNTQIPSTEINFEYCVTHMDIPIISHETGQYQIYPDFREIDKYTGVLRAWNLEIFKQRLTASGMADQDSIFQKASGAWAALCYRAEIEAAIRTQGFAGFQLLDLHDFPGQGTALVGILDAFMDSKKVITPEEWKQSCNDVVLLLEFPKYCWTTNEKYQAQVKVANYSNKPIFDDLIWKINHEDGRVIRQGTFGDQNITCGEITDIGEIQLNLSSLAKPEKLWVNISLENTEYSNSYPIWVYHPLQSTDVPEDILVVDKLNKEAKDYLGRGGKVLLFPETEDVSAHSFPGLFPPDFWNFGMFKGISERVGKPVSPGTLGILTDPEHPLFNSFPTDSHTNWQWFSIIKASNSFILDDFPGDLQPIVQVIDNLERNHKLGMIFEFQAGSGKLLVCMSQLNKIQNKPEAQQLYQSVIRYMESDKFKPDYKISIEYLDRLFSQKR